MNAVESIDADAGTVIVQSGVVLQALQERARTDGPAPSRSTWAVAAAARSAATSSTNAGGNRVIRYGMTRDLVLGVEAVLADGTVLDGLKPFVKNNTGFDLKQLFIGSEGVLGVVTRLVLRLIPKPTDTAVAFCGLRGLRPGPRAAAPPAPAAGRRADCVRGAVEGRTTRASLR